MSMVKKRQHIGLIKWGKDCPKHISEAIFVIWEQQGFHIRQGRYIVALIKGDCMFPKCQMCDTICQVSTQNALTECWSLVCCLKSEERDVLL